MRAPIRLKRPLAKSIHGSIHGRNAVKIRPRRHPRATSNWSSGEIRRICAQAINRVDDARKYAQMDRRDCTIRQQTQNCQANPQPRADERQCADDRFARSTERRNPLIREFTNAGNNRRRYIVPPPPAGCNYGPIFPRFMMCETFMMPRDWCKLPGIICSRGYGRSIEETDIRVSFVYGFFFDQCRSIFLLQEYCEFFL